MFHMYANTGIKLHDVVHPLPIVKIALNPTCPNIDVKTIDIIIMYHDIFPLANTYLISMRCWLGCKGYMCFILIHWV